MKIKDNKKDKALSKRARASLPLPVVLPGARDVWVSPGRPRPMPCGDPRSGCGGVEPARPPAGLSRSGLMSSSLCSPMRMVQLNMKWSHYVTDSNETTINVQKLQ